MRTPITSELREWAGVLVDAGVFGANEAVILTGLADKIDNEHKRRMDDCRLNTRRDAIRYMRGVLNDYDRNIRRVRKGDKAEVVRCADCRWARTDADHLVCHLRPLMAHYVEGEDYCSRGERREVDE